MGPIATPEETERYIEDNQEFFFVTVKVPEGLQEGDAFQVQVERESDDDPDFPPVEVKVPEGVEGGQLVRVQFTTGLPARPSDSADAARPYDSADEADAEDVEMGTDGDEDGASVEAATEASEGSSAEEPQLSPAQRDLWLRLEALPGITEAPLALRHELWRAYEWDRQGEDAQAVATLQTLLRHSEAAHAGASPVLANANRLLGMLLRDRSPPEAVAAFTAALELVPTSAYAYGDLGQALEVAADAAGVAEQQQGATEEAAAVEVGEVGEVLGDDGGVEAAPPPHPQEATQQWAAGGYEALMVRAAEAYGHAAALLPTDAGAHAALGRVEQALGRTDGASSALHSAVALSPTDPLNANELGVFLHTSHRHPEALLRFEAALALDTAEQLPVLRHNYAHSLLMNRRLAERDDEAGEYLRRALRLMPRHGESYRMLAGLRQDEMRWGEATALARQAVALLPSDVEAHQTLATALSGPDAGTDWRGRMLPAATAEEAMHHYRRGLQLEADRDDEPASLVVEQQRNETAPLPDGTFVQFYGELGGAKGSLPEVDQNLAGRERWEAVAGPPDDGYNWADGTAMLHASLIALLFSVLSLVGGCIMLRSLLAQAPERQARARAGR